jgi:hypothetical protein
MAQIPRVGSLKWNIISPCMELLMSWPNFITGILYLDLECWKWWQWHRNACQGYVAWTQFVAELYECFDTDTHHLGHLTKLKQSGTVEDFITTFEHLDFRMEGMSDAFF